MADWLDFCFSLSDGLFELILLVWQFLKFELEGLFLLLKVLQLWLFLFDLDIERLDFFFFFVDGALQSFFLAFQFFFFGLEFSQLFVDLIEVRLKFIDVLL